MPTRRLMVLIHLVLASVFMPFMLLIPLSGGLYLYGEKGDQTKEEVFTITETLPDSKEARENFFREHFKKQNIDYDFEYIRESGKDYIFRPTSREHYVATATDAGAVVSRVNPTLLKRLIEIHKGHGPRFLRTLEMFFAASLILVTLSGIWLAVTAPPYRKPMTVSFLLGALVIVWALF